MHLFVINKLDLEIEDQVDHVPGLEDPDLEVVEEKGETENDIGDTGRQHYFFYSSLKYLFFKLSFHFYRSRSRDRKEEKDREREKDKERVRKGLPPIKREHLSVCSTTLWVGHLSKLVSQEDLSDTFGAYGDIISIDLIPPRGCAFIVMNRRQDSLRALDRLKNTKLQGKTITVAWAPGKGMKGREWKDYWEIDTGVSYIPWIKLRGDTNLEEFEDGGCVDEDTLPDYLKQKLKSGDKENNKSGGQLNMEENSQDVKVNSSGNTNNNAPVPLMSIGTMPENLTSNKPNITNTGDNDNKNRNDITAAMMSGPPPGMSGMPPFGMPRKFHLNPIKFNIGRSIIISFNFNSCRDDANGYRNGSSAHDG
jgi:RNA recognition motif-containing protein